MLFVGTLGCAAGLPAHLAEPGSTHVSSPGPQDSAKTTSHSCSARQVQREDATFEKTWHVDLGLRVSHTKLGSTERQLDRRLDLPLKTDVFNVFRNPRTPIDRKSELGLNTLSIGVGRRESERLAWTWYLLGGMGTDKDHQRWLNLELDIDFKYANLLTGVRAEYYPWGYPRHGRFRTWGERFRESRPFLHAGVETGYVSGEGRGTYRISPSKVYSDKVTVRDWVIGVPAGIGLRTPLGERWSWVLSAGYTAHFYRPNEYNGWNAMVGLRYRFN